jgi:trans-2,3-dihydro-3-hydroxyanthranilate isomerase
VHDDAVARLEPDPEALSAQTDGLVGLAVYSLSADATRVHLRMFAPEVGVAEDPATGSAAVALAVHLVDRGLLEPDGESAFTVRAEGGRAVGTAVRGGVVAVSRGELVALP